jgi:hypothetical protein
MGQVARCEEAEPVSEIVVSLALAGHIGLRALPPSPEIRRGWRRSETPHPVILQPKPLPQVHGSLEEIARLAT